jgi:tRNA dimethylallyltransferase
MQVMSSDNNHAKKVYIVAGPTAVGKTAYAIQLAQQLGASIISADSRQCYKELNIGVARPSAEELATVPHYFIASHGITEEINAGYFEQYALQKVTALFQHHDSVVMVGGTGLYIKAFMEGIDPMPIIPDGIRENIISTYETKGLIWLQNELKHKDPLFWENAEKQNPQRLMRALEVFLATGKSIMEYRSAAKKQRPFAIETKLLEMPMDQLAERINHRVDTMIAAGLVDEVRSVIPYRQKTALQTVGYKEVFDYLDGNISLDAAIHQIKVHTRQYAKRQLTWFRKYL